MKIFLIVALVCSSLIFTRPVSAQWDYNQHMIDNMVEHRIDMRKTKARMEARRKGKAKRGKVSKTSGKSRAKVRQVSTPAKKPVVSLPSDVNFDRDTYQDFHLDDSKGYTVNFIFVSASGKTIRKSHNFTYYSSGTNFKDIPIGKYKVTAYGVYGGKKYPVHLGSEDGDTMNPLGGNFAPSIAIEVKPGKDQWGDATLLTLPETLHVRVID